MHPFLLILLCALYVISPVDCIPDVVPILGWLDDLGVIAYGWNKVTSNPEA